MDRGRLQVRLTTSVPEFSGTDLFFGRKPPGVNEARIAAGRSEVSGDESEFLEGVQQELHGYGGQQKAHDAGADAEGNGVQPAGAVADNANTR